MLRPFLSRISGLLEHSLSYGRLGTWEYSDIDPFPETKDDIMISDYFNE